MTASPRKPHIPWTFFVAGPEAETFVGGAGVDVLDLQASDAAVDVDLRATPSGLQTVSGGFAEGDVVFDIDKVLGSAHDDRLIGDDGWNVFEGGAGADTMQGGGGFDGLRYNGAAAGVTIDLRVDGAGFQAASGGDAQGDVISGFEKVVGSDFGDHLTGNAGYNVFQGGGGADTMLGGGGFDVLVYRGSQAGVTIDLRRDVHGWQHAEGGAADGDVISGFEKVVGSAHDDTFVGGVGRNSFVGGRGADLFVFATALGRGNVDRITDFNTADDTIGLASSIFTGLGNGPIDASAFVANTTGRAGTAADRILYDTTTGNLFYDADGTGDIARKRFARLAEGLALDETHFRLVSDPNRAPQAGDLAFAVDANAIGLVDLPVRDLNPADTFRFALGPGHASVDALGALRFAPAGDWDALTAGQSAVEQITYTVTDFAGASDSGIVTVTINGVNDAPIAGDDSVGGAEDTPLIITPLANDSDPDAGDAMRIVSVGLSDHGTAQIAADGQSITFTPAQDFAGLATLDYAVQDNAGARDTGRIAITIAATNDAPVAEALTATTSQDAPIDLTPVFTDPDAGDSHTIALDTTGLQGQVTPQADGTLRYDPSAFAYLAAGEQATDQFTYTVKDAAGAQSTATVTLTVTGVDDSVVAQNDSVTGTEDTVLTLLPLGNDSDPDSGDTLTITSLFDVADGTATIAADGRSIRFVPAQDFAGETRFDYAVSSSDGSTDRASVTLDFAPVNDAPVAQDMAVYVFSRDFAPGETFVPDFHDPDIGDGYRLSVNQPQDETSGEAFTFLDEIDGLWKIVYEGARPPVGEDYVETFTYTVTDDAGLSSTASITATTTDLNLPPEIDFNQRINGREDQASARNIVMFDPNLGEAVTVTGVRGVTHGTVAITDDALGVTFTPDADWNGFTTFEVQATDSRGLTSDWREVDVLISPVADIPTVDFSVEATAQGNQFLLTVTGTTTDNGDAISAIGKIRVSALDGTGTAFANQADFFDVTEANAFTRDSGSHSFLVTIPDYLTDGFTIAAEVDAFEGNYIGLATGSASFAVGLSAAHTDLSQSFGFADQSIWSPGGNTRHSASYTVGGTAGHEGAFYQNLFTGGGSYGGVGATAAVSTRFNGDVEISASITPEVWVEGGAVNGGVAYDAGITALRNDVTGQLTFVSDATPNVPLSWFNAGSPNAGFDVTLDALSFMARAYFQIWGYAQVHYVAGSSGPKPNLSFNLPETGVDLAGLLGDNYSLASFDGNTFTLLEGLLPGVSSPVSKTFTSGDPHHNELVTATVTKPVLSTQSSAYDSASVFGSSNDDFANLQFDLDGIASTIKDIKDPVDWSYYLNAGLLTFNAWFEALDLDLRTDFNYRQSHVLTPGDLAGTVTLEDGSEFDFVFGDTITVGQADDFDSNGDGQVAYTVSMRPTAQFQTKAEMLIDFYDHFSALDAGGSVDVGFNVGGLGTGFAINTGGPLFQASGTLLDQEVLVPLTTQDFAMTLSEIETATLFV